MRLQNKKTGEVVEWEQPISYKLGKEYDSLADLNAEWEDAPEEPRSYWAIDWTGGVNHITLLDGFGKYEKDRKLIGNYFESEEEAEKAVEKLKAFTRLKDKGFRFRWIDMQTGEIKCSFFLKKGQKITHNDEDDLLLLFGGEE